MDKVPRLTSIQLDAECSHLPLLNFSQLPMLRKKSILSILEKVPSLRGLDVSNTPLTLPMLSRIIARLPHIVAVYANNIGWGLDDEDEDCDDDVLDDERKKDAMEVDSALDAHHIIKSPTLEVFRMTHYNDHIAQLAFEVKIYFSNHEYISS